MPAAETLAGADGPPVQILDSPLLFVAQPVLHVVAVRVGEDDLLDFVDVLLQLQFFPLYRVQFRDRVGGWVDHGQVVLPERLFQAERAIQGLGAKPKNSAILGVVEDCVVHILKCSLRWLKGPVMPSLASFPCVIIPQSV